MSKERIITPRDFDLGFSFISYGVTIGIASDSVPLLEKTRELVRIAFGNCATIFEESDVVPDPVFAITKEGGRFVLYKNGLELSASTSEWIFFKFVNSLLRFEVAETAKGKVFVHAGTVGWNGQAIILPGMSFAGKSTLTAELVRNGAKYYSDEYAVLEENGHVGPFPRHLSMRYFGGLREKHVSAEDLGGEKGEQAIPVGMMLFTHFERGAAWDPQVLSPGEAIMELIPHTLAFRKDPAFSLRVLDLVAQRAIIIKSPRGDVKKFAKFLLAFFDKHTKIAKMT